MINTRTRGEATVLSNLSAEDWDPEPVLWLHIAHRFIVRGLDDPVVVYKRLRLLRSGEVHVLFWILAKWPIKGRELLARRPTRVVVFRHHLDRNIILLQMSIRFPAGNLAVCLLHALMRNLQRTSSLRQHMRIHDVAC